MQIFDKYGPILSVEYEKQAIATIIMVILDGFIGCKEGAVAPKRAREPPNPHFYNLSSYKTTISVQALFQWSDF